MTRRVTPDLPRSRSRGGYTLIELVITLALLGIAGTMVIPAMTQSGVLRTQAAVRTIVADITFLQGDALAYQERRAIWFNRYAEIDARVHLRRRQRLCPRRGKRPGPRSRDRRNGRSR